MHWLFGNRALVGGTLESCRIVLALLLLLPVAMGISLTYAGVLRTGLSPGQILVLLWALMASLPLLLKVSPQVVMAGMMVLAMVWLLIFAALISAAAVLGRLRSLSLINLLLAATAVAALSLLLQGLGAPSGSVGGDPSGPLFHWPLLEEFAADFSNRTILLDLGALALWVSLQFAPREPA